MAYVFNSLRENKVIAPCDKVAIGLPAFTPYFEIPELAADYQLVEVAVNADPAIGWQPRGEELEKIADPAVKIFITNPSNPPSVKINAEGAGNHPRASSPRSDPILIILTDDVYGTFADDFRSLFSVRPRNTALVYSFLQVFSGRPAGGQGVIAMHQDNVIDPTLKNLRRGGQGRPSTSATAPSRRTCAL